MAVLLEQFVKNLTTGDLVSKTDVRAASESLTADQRGDPRALADSLVRSGRLTRYQAVMLLRSRARALVVGKYLLLERMGQDGIGRVYKARHRKLDRVVVLKILDRRLESDPASVKRFRREMQIVARLTHLNIVQAFDAGRNRGRLYLAMEYVDGKDLGAIVTARGPLEIPRALEYVLQAARGLEYAHQQGVVHRDINPANLILDGEGTVKILDFGLATFERGGGGSSHLIRAGDPQTDFMPPERLTPSSETDQRSDIFSLGCVLSLLLTGQPPFNGASVTTRLSGNPKGNVPSLQHQLQDAPPALDAAFQRMIAPAPEDRYQSMTEVIRDLAPFAGESDSDQTTRPLVAAGSGRQSHANPDDRTRQISTATTATKRQSHHRRSAVVWGVASVVALILAGVVWHFQGTSDSVNQPIVEPAGDAGARPSARKEPSDSHPAAGAPVIAADGAVKVFILAGQSNMAGRGSVGGLSQLVQGADNHETFEHLKTAEGDWVVREDVWVRSVHYRRNDQLENLGALSVNLGQFRNEFGPELGFGHVVGNACEDFVLIIKVTQGPMSLGVEGRPPGSGGERGQYYDRLVQGVESVLSEKDQLFPALAGLRHEIAGLVWFQGYNDSIDATLAAEYHDNLGNLIRDLRKQWDVPRLPVVLGEFGQHGIESPPYLALEIRDAERDVAESPEFVDTVKFVETTPYVRDEGRGRVYLYRQNAETFYLIGEAFGRAMVELLAGSSGSQIEQSATPL